MNTLHPRVDADGIISIDGVAVARARTTAAPARRAAAATSQPFPQALDSKPDTTVYLLPQVRMAAPALMRASDPVLLRCCYARWHRCRLTANRCSLKWLVFLQLPPVKWSMQDRFLHEHPATSCLGYCKRHPFRWCGSVYTLVPGRNVKRRAHTHRLTVTPASSRTSIGTHRHSDTLSHRSRLGTCGFVNIMFESGLTTRKE